MYWAVIGDVVRSRAIPDRRRFQRALEWALERVNAELAAELVARCAVTAGDEFQALLRTPTALPRLTLRLCEELYPQRLRFGVGYGDIVTELKPAAVGMDGPAFHAARRAVEEARAGRHRVVVAVPGPRRGAVLRPATDVWDLALKVAERRSPAQVQVVRLYRRLGRQAAVAAELGIHQSVVSRHLQRALYAEVEAVLAHVSQLLEQAARGGAPAAQP